MLFIDAHFVGYIIQQVKIYLLILWGSQESQTTDIKQRQGYYVYYITP